MSVGADLEFWAKIRGVGICVGNTVGTTVGITVGMSLGIDVGISLGISLGNFIFLKIPSTFFASKISRHIPTPAKCVGILSVGMP